MVFCLLKGKIAQLVERWFEKPKVNGSIPFFSTKTPCRLGKDLNLVSLLWYQFELQEVKGKSFTETAIALPVYAEIFLTGNDESHLYLRI